MSDSSIRIPLVAGGEAALATDLIGGIHRLKTLDALDQTAPGVSVSASVDFQPIAGAIGALDVMGAADTGTFAFTFSNGIAVPSGSIIRLLGSELRINETALISGEEGYSLALYDVAQPSAQADNALWTLASADLAAYKETLSLGTPVDLGAACYIKTQFSDKQDFKLLGTSLFGRLITVGAHTQPSTPPVRRVTLLGVLL